MWLTMMIANMLANSMRVANRIRMVNSMRVVNCIVGSKQYEGG